MFLSKATGNTATISDRGEGKTKEEDDLLGRNIKRMPSHTETEEINNAKEDRVQISDELMEDAEQQETKPKQSMKQNIRRQISYKAKLLGEVEKTLDKSFDKHMKEWLKEEEEISPELTEEQREKLGSIPTLNISNDKLRDLCRPWKDALIITILGRRTNVYMMRDRIKRLLHSENFELIDLPNNYFVFRSVDKMLCSKLLFDGPWIIQGHYLTVQRWSPNFNLYCNKLKKVAVWIRVPTLPMHMYSEECMLEIGNLVG